MTAPASLPPDFFQHCALLCVDLQNTPRGPNLEEAQLPPLWKSLGITAPDVNAANAHAHDIALPNAIRIARACRKLGLPRIFLHWGYRFPDGMDLDPEIYATMRDNHGPDPARWHGHIDQPESQPHPALGIEAGDYVLPKSGQDAFTSSNLSFVLSNLRIRNLVLIGGHTEACLGKTARSAKARGCRLLCIEDATTNARESTRISGLHAIGIDFLMPTEAFLDLAAAYPQAHSDPLES